MQTYDSYVGVTDKKLKMTPIDELAVALRPLVTSIEFWTVQNTGWSGGVSWFDVEAHRRSPLRFDSEEEARDYIRANRWNDSAVKWRITHVQIERSPSGRLTSETWLEVLPEQPNDG